MYSSNRCASSLCLTPTLFRFTSTDSLIGPPSDRESLSGTWILRRRRVGRFVVEEAGELRVVNDDRRVALDGVEVFFLECVAGFRGNKHFPRKSDGAAGVFRGDRLLGG